MRRGGRYRGERNRVSGECWGSVWPWVMADLVFLRHFIAIERRRELKGINVKEFLVGLGEGEVVVKWAGSGDSGWVGEVGILAR